MYRVNTNIRLIKSLILPFFVVFTITTIGGQSRAELESKRTKLSAEIKETNNILSATRSDKKVTAAEVFALQEQITTRQANIQAIFAELELTDVSISNNEAVISSLTADLASLKTGYIKMLRHAYRNKNADKRLLFLLSSENFNNAIQRWQYLKRYDDQRKRQATLIKMTQGSLNKKVAQLKGRKEEKKGMAADLEEQKALVAAELAEKDKLLRQLKSEESKLLAALQGKKATKDELSNAIDVAIRADIRAQKTTAFANPNDNKKATKSTSGADKVITANFIKAKGSLPMPVTGNIVGKYGRQPHPTLKNITIKNNGIDIRTTAYATAKAVFEGEVTNVFFIPGNQNAVMVRHGGYYSVYSNLESVAVSKGAKISVGQIVGTVGKTKGTENYELHFEVWKGNKRLNPAYWIKK